MRGFFEGRYRDENLLVLQAEYRVQLYERWGAAIFLSAGDVSDSLRSFNLGDFRLAGGLGLRYAYNVKERINLRLDVAVTEESSGVYFSVGEAF
jgi:outer membrane translocation and assembly module TamA